MAQHHANQGVVQRWGNGVGSNHRLVASQAAGQCAQADLAGKGMELPWVPEVPAALALTTNLSQKTSQRRGLSAGLAQPHSPLKNRDTLTCGVPLLARKHSVFGGFARHSL